FRRLLGLDPLQQFFRHPFAPLGIHLSAPLQKFLDKQILIVPQPIISPEPILFFLRQRKCREATLPFFSFVDHQRSGRQVADPLFLSVKPHEDQTDEKKLICQDQDISQKDGPESGRLTRIRNQSQPQQPLPDGSSHKIFREYEVRQRKRGENDQIEGGEDEAHLLSDHFGHVYDHGDGKDQQQREDQRDQDVIDQLGDHPTSD